MTLQQLRYVIAIADHQSISRAAGELYVSQPSLSAAVRELETELGIELFYRTNRGIRVTREGNEFLGYARQLMEQYRLIDEKYIAGTGGKKKFSVSMQHYSFAVKAFVELVKRFGMDEYEFAVHETKTYEVMENVRDFTSEVGVLYRNTFNEKVLNKLLADQNLEFVELFQCRVYVYLWKGNPLADRSLLTMEDLEEFPCVSFEQGKNNSFYLAEEVLSTYQYKRLIKTNDRATALNLMVGLNAYTLCSGIICEELNGGDYLAIPLAGEETMTIGYIKRADLPLGSMARMYVEELKKYEREVYR